LAGLSGWTKQKKGPDEQGGELITLAIQVFTIAAPEK